MNPEPAAAMRRSPSTDPPWLRAIEHGTGAPLPQGRIVSFGACTALLLGAELRYLRLGDREILRRVHVAVRDPAWGTLAQVVTRADVVESPDRLDAAFELTHAAPGLAFDCTIGIAGVDAGLDYVIDGTFKADSVYNRIGICAMLPATFAGRPYTAAGPGGSSSGRLPELIGPQLVEDGVILALFPAFDQLRLRLEPDLTIELSFTGDLFEMEDQRNWTDDSFKIYSTPLALPFPRSVRTGDRLRQTLAVRVSSQRA